MLRAGLVIVVFRHVQHFNFSAVSFLAELDQQLQKVQLFWRLQMRYHKWDVRYR